MHGKLVEVATSDTHPPPELRRESLRRRLSELPVHPLEIEGAVHLASGLEAVLDLMWDKVERRFARLHSDGVRPARIWVR